MLYEDRQVPVGTNTVAKTQAAVVASNIAKPAHGDDGAEETITFDGDGDALATSGEAEQEEKSSALFAKVEAASATAAASKPTAKLSEADYEMVGEDTGGDDVEGDIGDDDSPLEAADYELDELEAEIARELED